jgi:hypothetical protein
MVCTVEVFATEDLGPDRRAAVIDVCVAAHESEEFRNLFSYIPSAGRHFLGYQDGELVSHAVVTTRGVQPGGERILRAAFVDAGLQTDSPGFDARLGWDEWRGPLGGRGDEGLIPTPDQRGVMIHRLPRTPALDLDARLTIEVQPTRIWE